MLLKRITMTWCLWISRCLIWISFQATKEIREFEQESGQKPLPIVALSAHAFSGYRDKCIERGMDDYLSKPFKKQALLGNVEKLLNSIIDVDEKSNQEVTS